MTDFSGLEQAIADQKAVDDQILAKLDGLISAAGTANAQGDQATVQSKVVEMQQHIAEVRAALQAFDGPAPSDVPAAPVQAGDAPAAAPAETAAVAPAAPADSAVTPASGGDATVVEPGK